MKRASLVCAVAFSAAGLGLYAQDTRKTKEAPARPAAAAAPAAEKAADRSADEKAISALLDAFRKAFNAGDADAAAATYTATALVVDEAGERTEGRAAIRNQYAASFAENPGNTIAIQTDALRF